MTEDTEPFLYTWTKLISLHEVAVSLLMEAKVFNREQIFAVSTVSPKLVHIMAIGLHALLRSSYGKVLSIWSTQICVPQSIVKS